MSAVAFVYSLWLCKDRPAGPLFIHQHSFYVCFFFFKLVRYYLELKVLLVPVFEYTVEKRRCSVLNH